MSSKWPAARLGEVLRRVERFESRDELTEYTFAGTYSYARGIFVGDTKPGSSFSLPRIQRIRAGDFIYCKIMAWEGAFGVAPREADNRVMSGAFVVYEPVQERIDRKFLDYFFKLPAHWQNIGGQSTGTNVRRRSLHPAQFERAEIPLPPLAEQRRIVARIEELAAQIHEARTLRHQATQEAEALLRSRLNLLSEKMSTGRKIGDALRSPPRNGWSARCDNTDGGTPVLSLSAVTGFRYRATEFKRTSMHVAPDAHFWLRPGDLLMTRSNTPELVGHAAIYDGSPFPCIYPDLMMRLELRDSEVNRRFVWYWLQSPAARRFVALNAKGTSPTMKKISQGTVMNIPFPTGISIKEQCRIVTDLDILQAEVDALKRLQAESAAELDALLPSILDKAFKGEL